MFIRPMSFGLFDPTETSCFLVALVQLVVAVIWTLQIYSINAFSLRLDISMVVWTPRLDGALDVSTMNWTSRRCIGRLDGALDVSDMIWTSSKGPKKSYKYDLANSLVSFIALSYNHQNHSKWPKWGHVRYKT